MSGRARGIGSFHSRDSLRAAELASGHHLGRASPIDLRRPVRRLGLRRRGNGARSRVGRPHWRRKRPAPLAHGAASWAGTWPTAGEAARPVRAVPGTDQVIVVIHEKGPARQRSVALLRSSAIRPPVVRRSTPGASPLGSGAVGAARCGTPVRRCHGQSTTRATHSRCTAHLHSIPRAGSARLARCRPDHHRGKSSRDLPPRGWGTPRRSIHAGHTACPAHRPPPRRALLVAMGSPLRSPVCKTEAIWPNVHQVGRRLAYL